MVGDVPIGGDAPVSIQSMTAGYTHEVDSCVAEINRLAEAGADIVRVAVPKREDTAVLPDILAQSPVPIVADVHFHYKRALEAIEAGVHKIRLNPGNIGDVEQVNHVIDACKAAEIPIILLENGYTEKNTTQIYHNHLIKDFVGIEKIIEKYL